MQLQACMCLLQAAPYPMAWAWYLAQDHQGRCVISIPVRVARPCCESVAKEVPVLPGCARGAGTGLMKG